MAKRNFSFIQKTSMVLEAAILLPLINIIAWICPYHKIFTLSKKIGRILLTKSKFSTIKNNLKLIFPNKEFTDEELYDVASVIAGYELRIIVEMTALSRMSFQQKLPYLRIVDHRYISDLFLKHPFIGITLHYGNWEVFGNIINELGISMGCLVERQFNFVIDNYLQKKRHALHIPIIYNEISQMRPLFQFLRTSSVGIVADQTYWFDPLFIPFFGQEVAVPSGAANLAIKTKHPIVYGFARHIQNGVYELKMEESIPFQATDNKDTDITRLMQTIYKRYEETIKQDVSNWYTLGTERWALTRDSLKEWEKNPDSSRF